MLFYFSCTGNSRWVALELARSLGEKTVDMSEAIAGTERYDDLDTVGLVFPIHGWRPPKLVRQFLAQHRIGLKPGAYVYALCTAGDSVGLAVDMLRGDMAQAGLHLDAVATLLMPESYVGLPFMDVDKPVREREKKAKAAEDLRQFADVVRSGRRGYEHVVKGHCPWLLTYPVGRFFVRHIVTDRPFRVDASRCIKCGRCATVCPVGNVSGGKGQMPEWHHKPECLSCFSCYHHCPTHAIEYGCRTRHKGQYFFTKNERMKE